MKKLLISIAIICSLLSGVSFLNYFSNENAINNSRENVLKILGFAQPYVAPYNEGNLAYEKRNYREAVIKYKKALEYSMPQKRECQVRINLALAIAMPVDQEYIENKGADEAIKVLESAIEVLTEKGCADHSDQQGQTTAGHSEDATQLKKDIEKYIEEIKQSQENKKDDKNNQPDDKDDPQEKEQQNNNINDEKMNKINEAMQKSGNARNKELQYQNDATDSDYYSGKTW